MEVIVIIRNATQLPSFLIENNDMATIPNTPAQVLDRVFRGTLHLGHSELTAYQPYRVLDAVETLDRFVRADRRATFLSLCEGYRGAHSVAEDKDSDEKDYAQFKKARVKFYSFLLRESYAHPAFGTALYHLGYWLDEALMSPSELKEIPYMKSLDVRESRFSDAMKKFRKSLLSEFVLQDLPETAFVKNPHSEEDTRVEVPEKFVPELSNFWRKSIAEMRRIEREAYNLYRGNEEDPGTEQEDLDRLWKDYEKVRYVPPADEDSLVAELIRFYSSPPTGVYIYILLDQEHLADLATHAVWEGKKIFTTPEGSKRPGRRGE